MVFHNCHALGGKPGGNHHHPVIVADQDVTRPDQRPGDMKRLRRMLEHRWHEARMRSIKRLWDLRYLSEDGKLVRHEVTEAQVAELYRTGVIPPDALARRGYKDRFRKLFEIREFRPLFQSPSRWKRTWDALAIGALRQMYGYLLSQAGAIPVLDGSDNPRFCYVGDVPPAGWRHSPWVRILTWLPVAGGSLIGAWIGALFADQLLDVGMVYPFLAIVGVRWMISAIPVFLYRRSSVE